MRVCLQCACLPSDRTRTGTVNPGARPAVGSMKCPSRLSRASSRQLQGCCSRRRGPEADRPVRMGLTRPEPQRQSDRKVNPSLPSPNHTIPIVHAQAGDGASGHTLPCVGDSNPQSSAAQSCPHHGNISSWSVAPGGKTGARTRVLGHPLQMSSLHPGWPRPAPQTSDIPAPPGYYPELPNPSVAGTVGVFPILVQTRDGTAVSSPLPPCRATTGPKYAGDCPLPMPP